MTKTQRQLEMLKDLHLVTERGGAGISIRRGERKHYAKLEKDGLVYFLSGFGRSDNLSIRLTDKGLNWTQGHFAYSYRDLPQAGQTTWQDRNGNVTLVVNGVAP